ncbi:unnamed protein product [Rotaria sp. Silwood1]|nr:unnamed protein product [Rotaria sp. Silwood1]CAF3705785.1 unnamed protein product [Rotaria sp. Silwood1]CAF4557518.1 unnamed protein product [Rotaria sp. Silwood1]CAF4759679.1 unnamed protein product [Rotaria sp. Silwood1]
MNSNSSLGGRSIFVIAGQRTFLVATFVGFVSWSSMSIQMSATPLAMNGVGYSFRQIITAIECHLLGIWFRWKSIVDEDVNIESYELSDIIDVAKYDYKIYPTYRIEYVEELR